MSLDFCGNTIHFLLFYVQLLVQKFPTGHLKPTNMQESQVWITFWPLYTLYVLKCAPYVSFKATIISFFRIVLWLPLEKYVYGSFFFYSFLVMNNKRSDDPSAASKECLIDLDHNKFKCKVPGCSKAFRKAKLLDYHLKYYHNTEKEMDGEVCSPERMGRTRATSASMPTSTLSDNPDNKRRRTVSTSSCRFPYSLSAFI